MLTTIFVMLLVLIVLLVVGFILLYRKLAERRMTVNYEPVVYYEKKLFREKIVAGHRTYIFYDGIPVGEPSERITYQSNEVDREAIEAALMASMSIVTKGMMVALGIPPIELSEVQEAIKKALDSEE